PRVLEAEAGFPGDQPGQVVALGGDRAGDALEHLRPRTAVERRPGRGGEVESPFHGLPGQQRHLGDLLPGERIVDREDAGAAHVLASDDAVEAVRRRGDGGHAATRRSNSWTSAFVAPSSSKACPRSSGGSESRIGTACSCLPPWERSGPWSAERSCSCRRRPSAVAASGRTTRSPMRSAGNESCALASSRVRTSSTPGCAAITSCAASTSEAWTQHPDPSAAWCTT